MPECLLPKEGKINKIRFGPLLQLPIRQNSKTLSFTPTLQTHEEEATENLPKWMESPVMRPFGGLLFIPRKCLGEGTITAIHGEGLEGFRVSAVSANVAICSLNMDSTK